MLSALVTAGPAGQGRKETTHNSISVVRGVGDERVRERREDPVMRRAWMGGRGGLHLHEDALQAWWCCPVVHGGGAGRGKMRETTRRRRSKCSSIRTQEQAGGADCGPSLSPPIGLAVSSRAHGTPRTCRGPRASPAPRGRAPAAPPRAPLPFPLPCASKADEMESLRRAPGPGPGQTYPIPARLSGESDRAGRQARARPT